MRGLLECNVPVHSMLQRRRRSVPNLQGPLSPYEEEIKQATTSVSDATGQKRSTDSRAEDAGTGKYSSQTACPATPFKFSQNQTLVLLLQEKAKSKTVPGNKQTSNTTTTEKETVATSTAQSSPSAPDNGPNEESDDVSGGEDTNQEPTSSEDSYSSDDSFIEKDDEARGGYSEEDWEPSDSSAKDREEDSSSDDDANEEEDDKDNDDNDEDETKGDKQLLYSLEFAFFKMFKGYISEEGNIGLAVRHDTKNALTTFSMLIFVCRG